MADVIDAWCIACPDGQTRWCKDDPKDAATTWAQWRNGLPAAQREAYEQAGVLGGIVKIRMLRADFDRLTSGVAMPAYTHADVAAAHAAGYELGLRQKDRAPDGGAAGVPLAKHQPCGCVICTCEDEEQCHGCGAKNCGTHPVGQFPNPADGVPGTQASSHKLLDHGDVIQRGDEVLADDAVNWLPLVGWEVGMKWVCNFMPMRRPAGVQGTSGGQSNG